MLAAGVLEGVSTRAVVEIVVIVLGPTLGAAVLGVGAVRKL